MKVPILDLKRQTNELKEEIIPKVTEITLSGNYIMGQEVNGLEKELEEYLGVKHAITVGNGTDALVIALEALGIKDGDEVITTPFSFFATAETIATVGAKPVFVDVVDDNFNIDVSKIEEKITNKTKAILPVHIFGHPAKMDEINEIAKKHNLKVIEDACQAIGAEYKDKKIGSTADLGCFSFFPTKNLGAFGDGGLITTNDDNLNIICRALREHAGGQIGFQARAILENKQNELEELKQVDPLYNPYKYFNYLIAHNSRLDAIQAGILRIKLKQLDKWNAKRDNNAKYYIENLQNIGDIVLPKKCSYGNNVWHQFAIKTNKKDELIKYLASKEITAAGFYPTPLHLQKAFDYLKYEEGNLPVSEKLSKQTVCLPIFPELTQEELKYVVDTIKEFYEEK